MFQSRVERGVEEQFIRRAPGQLCVRSNHSARTVAMRLVGTQRSVPESDHPVTVLPSSAWVVVCAYREEERLGPVLEGLLRVARNIVVVDDGSDDDTYLVALQFPVWVVRHAINLGQGAALQTGIRFALSKGAQYVATFDGDGQHDPADLPRLYWALVRTGAHYALGSRFLGSAPGIPRTRRLVLRAGIWFTRVLSGIRVTDTHNGLRMFTRQGAMRLRITMNGMAHASELLDQIAASGLPYVEVPVTIRYSEATLAKGQQNRRALSIAFTLLGERLAR